LIEYDFTLLLNYSNST